MVSRLILRKDPIYDLRRTTALSFFCWILWLFFMLIGFAISKPFGFPWCNKLYLLGFSAILILRLTVLNGTSSTSYTRVIAASTLQPLACIIPFLLFWSIDYFLTSVFLISSLAISVVSSFTFLLLLNRIGQQTLGFPSLSFFKAFLVNWITDLNAPLERFLEKIGEQRDVELSLMRFDTSQPKAAIIVPAIHPGPFKNVGSSLLPSTIKAAVEKELNCVACVPHGLLGHELDLASQKQNQKITNHIINSIDFETSETKATPFIKVSNRLATACCQVFGHFALVSFTLAPKTTEDLPQELGGFVHEEAARNGVSRCTVVNAHNSINGTINVREALDILKDAAADCLKKTASLNRLPFEVGVATVKPEIFSLKDGMGPGGITAVVVKVGEQKTAYVVIDGNNMVSGLREKILSTLKSQGISEGEILTTDTHSVNALILDGRGYHPIGETMNHKKLMEYIREATLSALSNLERVKVGAHTITVPNIKVIGEKKLKALCLLADRTIRRAKKIAVPLFATTGLLLTCLLAFL